MMFSFGAYFDYFAPDAFFGYYKPWSSYSILAGSLVKASLLYGSYIVYSILYILCNIFRSNIEILEIKTFQSFRIYCLNISTLTVLIL